MAFRGLEINEFISSQVDYNSTHSPSKWPAAVSLLSDVASCEIIAVEKGGPLCKKLKLPTLYIWAVITTMFEAVEKMPC